MVPAGDSGVALEGAGATSGLMSITNVGMSGSRVVLALRLLVRRGLVSVSVSVVAVSLCRGMVV